MDATRQAARSIDISTEVAPLHPKRTTLAQERFGERLAKAYAECAAGLAGMPVAPAAAGIVLGAKVPIILTSRADSVVTRLASCAVAAMVASARCGMASRSIA